MKKPNLFADIGLKLPYEFIRTNQLHFVTSSRWKMEKQKHQCMQFLPCFFFGLEDNKNLLQRLCHDMQGSQWSVQMHRPVIIEPTHGSTIELVFKQINFL